MPLLFKGGRGAQRSRRCSWRTAAKKTKEEEAKEKGRGGGDQEEGRGGGDEERGGGGSRKDEGIDLDGHHFGHILNFLRHGTIQVELNTDATTLALEAEFYGLADLVSVLRADGGKTVAALEHQRPQALADPWVVD